MLFFLHEHVLFLQPVLQAHDTRFCNVPGAIGSTVPIGVKNQPQSSSHMNQGLKNYNAAQPSHGLARKPLSCAVLLHTL